MNNYTPIQEMFLMDMSSDAGSRQSGNESTIYAAIQNFLANYGLTNWEIVWGPGVNTKDKAPSNVLYLAYDRTTSRYFLSVAGTDPYSFIDDMDDMDVSTTRQWAFNGAGKDVRVANEASKVLQVLTSLEAACYKGGKPTGQRCTIGTYLQQQFSGAAASSYTMIVGGHSLGGAMSPIMALWLADTKTTWDANGAVKGLSCYPAAGPSIGTQPFQTYYGTRVPDTTRIHNTLDVVPHAWNVADLKAITTLYQPAIADSSGVDNLVKAAIIKTLGNHYVQIDLKDLTLNGAVNSSLINPGKTPWQNFVAQMLYQHINAYYDLLGLPVYKPAQPELAESIFAAVV